MEGGQEGPSEEVLNEGPLGYREQPCRQEKHGRPRKSKFGVLGGGSLTGVEERREVSEAGRE